jgi:hypothetical protein
MSEPAIALRTARHWYSEGCRWRVLCEQTGSKLQFLRGLRTLFGCGLQQALATARRLQGDGLVCLRAEEAIAFQASLGVSTLPVILPWSPDERA